MNALNGNIYVNIICISPLGMCDTNVNCSAGFRVYVRPGSFTVSTSVYIKYCGQFTGHWSSEFRPKAGRFLPFALSGEYPKFSVSVRSLKEAGSIILL